MNFIQALFFERRGDNQECLGFRDEALMNRSNQPMISVDSDSDSDVVKFHTGKTPNKIVDSDEDNTGMLNE